MPESEKNVWRLPKFRVDAIPFKWSSLIEVELFQELKELKSEMLAGVGSYIWQAPSSMQKKRFLFSNLSLTKYQTSLCSEWALCSLKRKSWFAKKIALNLFPGSLVQENRAERKLTEWNLMQQFISHFCGNHPFEICYCYCYNNTNEVKLLEF